ncbi:lipopolysaccharide assembly LapA domain-containing protein [Saccharopolyspora gloriosae]|uniref:LapA family protein n=1 Tax=Saccharopolyspora gloriosae TaxID=455344 RepID=UPI001FB62CCF|nr:lipopolysaccharide assembly protein LapA domain-containing protein [Saccharopolyspora gloriosae]
MASDENTADDRTTSAEPLTEPERERGELEPAAPIAEPTTAEKLQHTRTAGTWAAVVVATIALIVLLVFILQNLQPTSVTFLGLRGDLPVGVALLLAAAIGGLLVALVGAARILQLRRTAGRRNRSATR